MDSQQCPVTFVNIHMQETELPLIQSHTGFQPLREVWLGDCYPEDFYDHLKNPELRDFCLKINEMTKIDLAKIQAKIESFGVRVCRPKFRAIDDFLDDTDNLCKPPITPRDWALTLGDTLYIAPQYLNDFQPWQQDIDRYQTNAQRVRVLKRFQHQPEDWCWITFPSVVRCGKDVYIDYDPCNQHAVTAAQNVAQELVEKYRVHLGTSGDHSDAVFCPVKPGVIVATHYRQHYGTGWPGWQVMHLPDTSAFANNGFNGKWWVPGHYFSHFNDQMIDQIKSWIGDSKETVFEVNMLVIDEKNLLILAPEESVCRRLEELGITAHVVDFRCRGFWDGGLHCLTLDIHREGGCIDYWPGRGANSVMWDA